MANRTGLLCISPTLTSPRPPAYISCYSYRARSQGADSPPLPVTATKAGRNHMKKEMTSLYSLWELNAKQRPLADVSSPFKWSAELTQSALYISHYSESHILKSSALSSLALAPKNP